MDPIQIIDKYYSNQIELRNILLTHSQQVAERSLRIIDNHPELGIDRQFIYEAAMLHDIGIFLCDAPNIYCYGTHQYIEHGYLGAELLRKEGLPLHAGVAERHTGAGITADQIEREEYPIPIANYIPLTIEEELICYADKFYSKSRLTETATLSKVRYSLWLYGSEAVQRFDRWQQTFEPGLSAEEK